MNRKQSPTRSTIARRVGRPAHPPTGLAALRGISQPIACDRGNARVCRRDGSSGDFLVQHLMHIGFNWCALLYAGILIAGAFGAIFFMRRANALHREATQTHTAFPHFAAGFSTLSDGSQRWKNLEDLR